MTLQESIENIARGVPVDAQVNRLLETLPPKSRLGWWPHPGSDYGNPISSDVWAVVLLELLDLSQKKGAVAGLRTISKKTGVPPETIVQFMKEAGLWNTFHSGSLDRSHIIRVISGAQRSSGIWAVIRHSKPRVTPKIKKFMLSPNGTGRMGYSFDR